MEPAGSVERGGGGVGGGAMGWGRVRAEVWARGGCGGAAWQPCRSRDEEWDQEPCVHEGCVGGLGKGGSMRSGKAGVGGHFF